MKFFVFLLVCIQFVFAAPLEIEVKAKHAILMNAENGKVLFEKEGRTLAYPASTTKIATALYTLEHVDDLERKLKVSRESMRYQPEKEPQLINPYWLDYQGTMMQLKVGEELSLDALLHGLILVSGNDAANVIAEHLGGTIPAFVEHLNLYLQSIGCQNTTFCNPHGLHFPDHQSTVYDIAIMMKRALKIPKFRKIISEVTYQKSETNKQPALEIVNTNSLIKPKSTYYDSKVIGGKSGYTKASQCNLAVAAEGNGRALIAVVFGCKQKSDCYEDVKKMCEKAFAEPLVFRKLIGTEATFTREAKGAKKIIRAGLVFPLGISFYPSEDPQCKAVLHWKVERLPIQKGEKVGEVHILDEGGALLAKGDLVARDEVRATIWHQLQEFFR